MSRCTSPPACSASIPAAAPCEQPERAGQPDLALGHDALGQRAARDEGLDEIGQPALLAVGEHRHHVLVLDALRRLDLAAEAPQEDLVLRELGRDDLDGDRLAAVLGGLEDDPHAPATDHPGDPVGTDRVARPGLEGNVRHSSAASIVGAWSGGEPQLPTSTPCAPPPEPGDCRRSRYGQANSRRLSDRGDRGGRAHGRRVSRDRPLRAQGRAQGAARGRGDRPRLPRALPPRGPDARRAGPSPRHPDPRDGRDRRPALHRHPADREHAARPHRRRARSPSTTRSRSSPRWPTRSTPRTPRA